jgi:5-formyltetrahydrofolate cyclo-ligase
MKKLEEFLKESNSQKSDAAHQKKVIRERLLSLRKEIHKYADPQNWGPKQFYRSLELLKINKIEDLKGKYLISCFFPIRDELEISTFAQKDWLFPKISANKELLWFEYGDGKSDYEVNSFGIREKNEQFCFSYENNSLPMLCFLPGLAAAQDGTRLGYGGGFYDKFLTQYKEKVTSVLCLPSQEFLFDKLPTEIHDEKVDLIVF